MHDDAVVRVAQAIEKALCSGRGGPYGLYDYTSYGDPKPHHVRDFRDMSSDTYGSCVLRTDDKELARQTYDRLTREHPARAAIAECMAILGEPTEAMLDALRHEAALNGFGPRGGPRAIRAALAASPLSDGGQT